MSSLQMELHRKSKAFHAEIARRAKLIQPKPECSYSIPNGPLGAPKVRPAPARKPVERNIEPDYWPVMWFHDLVFGKKRTAQSRIWIEDIINAVAVEYNVSRIDLLSPRRDQKIVLPRHVTAYLAKRLTGRSLPEIGRHLGRRDHTSILFAVAKIERLIAADSELAERVSRIARSLGGGQ